METGKCVVPYFKTDNSSGYKTFKDEEQWVQDALDFLNEKESVASAAAEDAHSAAEDTTSSAGHSQRIHTESAEDLGVIEKFIDDEIAEMLPS